MTPVFAAIRHSGRDADDQAVKAFPVGAWLNATIG